MDSVYALIQHYYQELTQRTAPEPQRDGDDAYSLSLPGGYDLYVEITPSKQWLFVTLKDGDELIWCDRAPAHDKGQKGALEQLKKEYYYERSQQAPEELQALERKVEELKETVDNREDQIRALVDYFGLKAESVLRCFDRGHFELLKRLKDEFGDRVKPTLIGGIHIDIHGEDACVITKNEDYGLGAPGREKMYFESLANLIGAVRQLMQGVDWDGVRTGYWSDTPGQNHLLSTTDLKERLISSGFNPVKTTGGTLLVLKTQSGEMVHVQPEEEYYQAHLPKEEYYQVRLPARDTQERFETYERLVEYLDRLVLRDHPHSKDQALDELEREGVDVQRKPSHTGGVIGTVGAQPDRTPLRVLREGLEREGIDVERVGTHGLVVNINEGPVSVKIDGDHYEIKGIHEFEEIASFDKLVDLLHDLALTEHEAIANLMDIAADYELEVEAMASYVKARVRGELPYEALSAGCAEWDL